MGTPSAQKYDILQFTLLKFKKKKIGEISNIFGIDKEISNLNTVIKNEYWKN